MIEGRTGGGGAAASGGVLVGSGGGEEPGGSGELGDDVGVGTFEDGIDEGVAVGGAAGAPLVAHWPAQYAVSWCSQKQRSAHVAQLPQAGALVHPAV